MLEITDAAGNRRAFESAVNIDRSTRKGIRRAFFDIGHDLISTFNRQVLDKSRKTGVIYRFRDRAGRLRRHQASGAGESPANRKGNYRRGIGFLNQTDRLTFGNRTEYAGFLEGGTSRMRARLGLGNALRENERNILRSFSSSIAEEL